MSRADALMEPLCHSKYTTSMEFNASLVGRRWLMRWAEGCRTHHLHLMMFGSQEWDRRLAFRDVLRANTELAQPYVENRDRFIFLCRQPRRRRDQRRQAKQSGLGKIPHRTGIEKRPLEAESRLTLGHREGDTVLHRHKQSGLATLVERRSSYLLAGRLAQISVDSERSTKRWINRTIAPESARDIACRQRCFGANIQEH